MGSPELAIFVEAAQYGHSERFVAVAVDHRDRVLNSTSVRKVSAAVAEQVAIALALAMKDPLRLNIFTDSRAAVRAFDSVSVSREGAAILGCEGTAGHRTIKWFPAHRGANVHPDIPNTNELAHDHARGFPRRSRRIRGRGRREV